MKKTKDNSISDRDKLILIKVECRILFSINNKEEILKKM